MVLDPKNVSAGEEQYEMFSRRIGRRVRRMFQYDYRDDSGKLFSCVALSLDDARAKRDQWLASR